MECQLEKKGNSDEFLGSSSVEELKHRMSLETFGASRTTDTNYSNRTWSKFMESELLVKVQHEKVFLVLKTDFFALTILYVQDKDHLNALMIRVN